MPTDDTGPLIGLAQWPGVRADYRVCAGRDGAPGLVLRLAFDRSGFPAGSAAARQALDVYERLRLQCAPTAAAAEGAAPAVVVSLSTSLVPGQDLAFDAAMRATLMDWLFGPHGVHAFLSEPAEPAEDAGDSGEAAAPQVSAPCLIAMALPPASLGTEPLVELAARFTLSRPADPSEAGRAGTQLAPCEDPVDDGDGLVAFARDLEACLAQPGVALCKLASSVDGSHSMPRAGRRRLWLVRLGLATGQAIGIRLPQAPDPLVFALRPLYRALQARTALPCYAYITGKGIDFTRPSGTRDVAGVDAELWMRQFLAAMDTMLSPAWLGPVQAIDSLGGTGWLGQLRAARERLAQSLSELVMPLFADQAPSEAQHAAARESLRRQALAGLTPAHRTDALIQFGATVAAGGLDPAARLHGTMLPAPGSDPRAGLVADALPLRSTGADAGTPFTLLATAADDADGAATRAMALDLRFRGTHIELPGRTPGSSTWLAFVIPPAPDAGDWPLDLQLGRFEAPLPLRAPPVLSLGSQHAATHGVEDPSDWRQVARALTWDYRFTYAMPAYFPHDTMHATTRFNADGADRRGSGKADLLAALFAFADLWPRLQPDLDGALAGLALPPPDTEPLDPVRVGTAAAALGAFAQLAGRVADAFAAFVSQESAAPGAASAADAAGSALSYTYVVTGSAPQRIGPDGAAAPALQIVVEPVPPDGAQRGVTLPGLDLFALRSARTLAVSVERNPCLVGQRRTAPAFVLRSPPLAFPRAVRPAAHIADAVELAAFGSGVPAVRSVADQFDNFFDVLFAGALRPQTIALSVAYAVPIAGVPVDVTMPILMLPAFGMLPRHADAHAPVPGAGAQEPMGQAQLVAALSTSLHGWFAAQRPAPGGELVVSLTVLGDALGDATGDAVPAPLLALPQLRLRHADWSDAPA